MATSIGVKLGIDGEAEYRKQLNNIVQTTKTLDKQLAEVASAFDDEADAITDEFLASIGVDLGAQMPMAPQGRVAAPAQRTKTNDKELEDMLAQLGI